LPPALTAQAAAALAAALLDGTAPLPALPCADAQALAWALKDAAYAAWRSAPAQAGRAAQVLRQLAAAWPDGGLPVAALADWTDGVAALAGGRMADAQAALARASGRWQALQRPLEAAQTQVPQVMALSMLGRHDDAAACAQAALQAFIALGDRAAAGKVSLNLGSLQMRRDDYAEAARHYRSAAVLFARVRDTECSVMADIGSADALTAQGDFAQAQLLYARARMRAERHGLPLLAGLADESLALLHLARGVYDTALAGLEQARRRYAALQLPHHLATAEKQLADAYLELRLLPEALALYDQCLATMQALDAPDDLAWTQLERGRTLALLGRSSDAARALAEAGAQFGAADNAPGSAAVALAQAEQALADGDGPAAARLAQQAAAAYADGALAEGLLRAQALHAAALLRGGDIAAARAGFEAALGQAQQLSLQALVLRCRSGLGLAALAAGDEAGAATALQAAVAQADAQWRLLPGDELRGAFLADHLAPHQGLLTLALRAHDRQPGPDAAAQVLLRLDAVRARALAARLRHGRPDAADATTQDLRARLHWLQRRVQRQADDGDSSPTLQAAVHRAEQGLLEHARRLRLTAAVPPAEPAPNVLADDALDLPALQAALAATDAVVLHGRHGDELLACVLRHDGVQLLRGLGSWAAVQAAIDSVQFQLGALRHGAAPVQAHLALLGQRAGLRLQQLHALVWAPLAPLLAGVQRVLLVPPAGLSRLPWAALHDGQHSLLQRHTLAQAPSLRVAAWALARPSGPARRVLALGDGARLPHAGREAQAVAALFGPGCGLALVNAQATLAALQQHAAVADVLHLACHAHFRADNPMFAALHLHDGPLTAERAESLPLRAATVVLSACDTGLAGEAGGDEQVGLVRAFLLAGAARVLASLWPVDDAITAALMAAFYAALLQGQAPAAALQQAQQQLMQQHPHPAFWAGFVLHGAW